MCQRHCNSQFFRVIRLQLIFVTEYSPSSNTKLSVQQTQSFSVKQTQSFSVRANTRFTITAKSVKVFLFSVYISFFQNENSTTALYNSPAGNEPKQIYTGPRGRAARGVNFHPITGRHVVPFLEFSRGCIADVRGIVTSQSYTHGVNTPVLQFPPPTLVRGYVEYIYLFIPTGFS